MDKLNLLLSEYDTDIFEFEEDYNKEILELLETGSVEIKLFRKKYLLTLTFDEVQ